MSVLLLQILIVTSRYQISELGTASNSDCNVVGIKLVSYVPNSDCYE